MTAFDTKLAAARAGAVRTTDPGIKRAVWLLLLACGGAVEPEERSWDDRPELTNFYAGNLRISYDLTVDTLERGLDIIDWEASDDPTLPCSASSFTDTFSDPETFWYLAGQLRFTDGRSLWWGATMQSPEFGSVVRAITGLDLTFAEAVEHLTDRVTSARDPWAFTYGCKVPHID